MLKGLDYMISFTAKLTKPRIFLCIACVLIPFLIFSSVYITKQNKPEILNQKGETYAQRVAFLKQFGWECGEEESIKDTIIPNEFDNVYTSYNNIQLTLGFDLSNYKGKTVKLYTIKINNYPENSEYVYASVLVYEGTIIGGDIHSTELSGFMHSF